MYMGTILLVSEYYVSNGTKLGKCTKYPEHFYLHVFLSASEVGYSSRKVLVVESIY